MTETPKIFVVPGAGVKVPLPIPGGDLVPAEGRLVVETMHVTRLLNAKDLVIGAPLAGTAAAAEMKTKQFDQAKQPVAQDGDKTPAAVAAAPAKGEK